MHIRRFNRQSRKKNNQGFISFNFQDSVAYLDIPGSSTCISPQKFRIWSDGLLVFQHILRFVQILKMQNSVFFLFLWLYEPLRVQSLKAIRSEFTYSVVVATLVFWVNRSTDMYSLIINLSHTTLAKRRQRAKLLTSIN